MAGWICDFKLPICLINLGSWEKMDLMLLSLVFGLQWIELMQKNLNQLKYKLFEQEWSYEIAPVSLMLCENPKPKNCSEDYIDWFIFKIYFSAHSWRGVPNSWKPENSQVLENSHSSTWQTTSSVNIGNNHSYQMALNANRLPLGLKFLPQLLLWISNF
jgi:hypothetical protein